MKQLLVFDFDGTLFQQGNERQFQKILKTIKEKDVPFAVASGRPLHLLRPYFEEMLNKVFLISNDGAMITLGETVLYSHPADKEKLADFCSKQQCDYVCYGQLLSYLKISAQADYIRLRRFFRQHAVRIRSANEISESVYKVFVFEAIACPDFLTPTYHRRDIFEFVASGANKANAVRWLAGMLNVKPEHSYVFGDGANDIPMLELTDRSYAMIQASPAVKQAANHVCSNLYETVSTILERGDQ